MAILINTAWNTKLFPRLQSLWGQHGAYLGPVGPRWVPCWPHEPSYRGLYNPLQFLISLHVIWKKWFNIINQMKWYVYGSYFAHSMMNTSLIYRLRILWIGNNATYKVTSDKSSLSESRSTKTFPLDFPHVKNASTKCSWQCFITWIYIKLQSPAIM